MFSEHNRVDVVHLQLRVGPIISTERFVQELHMLATIVSSEIARYEHSIQQAALELFRVDQHSCVTLH